MMAIILLLLILILISVCAGFYQIVKQQGRILLRLDQLEQTANAGAVQNLSAEAELDGLPLGTDFPAFSFPDLSGRSVALAGLRGKRVLLVHWSFACGFCTAIAPELARLEATLATHNAQLLLLTEGDAASHQKAADEYGLKCPILLMKSGEAPEPFHQRGTPVAYLLDEAGRIAAPFASGADRVLPLARELAGEGASASPAGQVQPSPVTDFPSFSFPDLAGKMVALEDLRGKRVLLVHWNFDCGFCESIAPELGRLEARLEQENTQLILLAKGDEPSNRTRAAAHGLSSRILLLQGREKPQPFEHRGTPVAYLLDEEGRIVAPFASGSTNVLSLARQAAGLETGALRTEGLEPRPVDPPSQPTHLETGERHRIRLPGFAVGHEIGLGEVIKRVTSAFGIKACVGCERRAAWLNRWLVFSGIAGGGLKAGKRAPGFRLPDLQGRMVSLAAYRGRRVLLVFSDPHCGPCDELAPHLARLHHEHGNNGLAVVQVGRGEAEENRRKADQHGLQFPVVIQEKSNLSKQYGVHATPVAFLIGQDGVIAKNVAVGTDAVLTLARDGLGTKERGNERSI